jgi:GT2 family glycosyltransferase
MPCPGELPAGAAIHSCEQNPWETAHVLANGDVVACEVHDRVSLGNLARQGLAEVWNGEPYRRFRERYRAGGHAACRSCPWKTAFVPGPLRGEILAARGRSAQLAYGWHEPEGEPHVWASQQAAAVLQPPYGSGVLHIHGMLPPGPGETPNRLSVSCNGAPVGEVRNDGEGILTFGVDLRVVATRAPWEVEFRTEHVYHAAGDQRDLGFALATAAAKKTRVEGEHRHVALWPLTDAITGVDRLGRALKARFRRGRADEAVLLPFGPGVTVIIPEHDNPEELSECLGGLEEATSQWPEALEAIVVVNGTDPHRYDHLRAAHPWIQWQFHPRPLGFCGAVAAGLRSANYDWVYLLNSDAVPTATALVEAGRWRAPLTFSVASQIYLKDETRFREETNRTRLFLEEGLVTIHDLLPNSTYAVEHFYAGGGASMFQTRLLRRMIEPSVYHPFYWEDVEWGWQARKMGYRSVFCASSVVRHAQRATIARHFPDAAIDAVFQRNRLLFQLRNLTSAGAAEAAVAAIAGGSSEEAEYFVRPRTLAAVVRGRLWNHLAAVSEGEVLEYGSGGQCIEGLS